MRELRSLEVLTAVAATVRAGTPLRAARAIGCAPSTVYRAIERLEAAAGLPLFARTQAEWHPTPAARRIAELAGRIESETASLEEFLRAQSRGYPGRLRISASDGFAEGYLGPVISAFTHATPGVMIELIADNQFADLKRLEAEIAIRPDQRPGETLVGRRAGRLAHALYASADLLAARGPVSGITDLARMPICLLSDRLAHFTAAGWWSDDHAGVGWRERITFIANTEMGLTSAVASGAGIGILPCYLAGAYERLRRIESIPVNQPVDIWLLTTPALRTNNSVRTLLNWIAAAMKRDARLLSGAVASGRQLSLAGR